MTGVEIIPSAVPAWCGNPVAPDEHCSFSRPDAYGGLPSWPSRSALLALGCRGHAVCRTIKERTANFAKSANAGCEPIWIKPAGSASRG